jgi:hypothetical protein
LEEDLCSPLEQQELTPARFGSDNLRRQLAALEARLAPAQQAAAAGRGAAAAAAALDAALQAAQLQRARADGLEREVEAWQEKCRQASRERASVQPSVDGARAQAAALEGTVAALQADAASLAAALADARAGNERLVAQMSALQQAEASATRRLQAEQAAAAALAAEQRQLAHEAAAAKQEVGHLRRLLEMLAAERPLPPQEQDAVTAPACEPPAAPPQAQAGAATASTPAAAPAAQAPRPRPPPSEPPFALDFAASHRRPPSSWRQTEQQPAAPAALREPAPAAAPPVPSPPPPAIASTTTASQPRSNPFQSAEVRPLPPSPSRSLLGSRPPRLLLPAHRCARPPAPRPLQEVDAEVARLETHLLRLNLERAALQVESSRFPSATAGRTVAERRRRAEVEARLSELGRESSGVRLAMKRLGCL